MILLCIPLTVAFVCFKVGEIHFKNSYVAYITVKAKCRITDSKDGKTPNFPQIFQTIYLSKIDLYYIPSINFLLFCSEIILVSLRSEIFH